MNLPASKDLSKMTGGATSNMESSSVSDSQAPVFHGRSGQLVTLSQAGRTASRSHATQVHSLKIWKTGQTKSRNLQEFNHGLVLSAAPLLDNQMVEVSDIYIYMMVWNSTR